jgi:hypothetical protein
VSKPKCVTHFTGCACSEARWQRLLERVTRERDEWKWEYENLCKFATDFEQQRDALRAQLAQARDALKFYADLYEDQGERAHAALKKINE